MKVTTINPEKSADNRRRRRALIEAGLCAQCGKWRGRKGSKTLCEEHKEALRTNAYERLQEKLRRKICWECNKRNENGKSHCDSCLDRSNRQTANRRKERRERGECLFCGDPVLEINPHTNDFYALDRKCRNKQYEKNKARAGNRAQAQQEQIAA